MQSQSTALSQVCSKCHQVKHLSYFRSRTGRPTLNCRACRDYYTNRRRGDVGLLAKQAARVRLKLYGITQADYDRLFLQQDGLCAICRRPETGRGSQGSVKSLGVDHDHATGKVRGLLCGGCNQAVGRIETSEMGLVDWMAATLAYLNITNST